MTDEEFGDLTYGLLEALLSRKKEAERKEFLRTGMIVAAVINFGFNRPENPVKPLDFVPQDEEKEDDLSKLPPEEQAARMLSMFSKKTFTR